ncbi:MAG TPA: MFS transporter [Steroidobacteraceae bacterium]|nr:MFS transporter [Steroidobacteraceae bacterium]
MKTEFSGAVPEIAIGNLRTAAEDSGNRSSRQVALASGIGTTAEWYDFFVFGTAAALVFPKLFFPRFSPFAGTLASFATFGVAFFARPIGGACFGHFGDRVGRKALLVTTLLLMGGATFLIGLLPTFGQVGVLAPILLVALRIVQGFAVGGEWGGATLMAVEHAPEQRRNFYASWPQMGVPIGLMLSAAVFAGFSTLSEPQFLAWGWRGPFLLSIVLIGVGLMVRLRVAESPVFSRVKELGEVCRAPLRDLLRDHSAAVILAVGVVFFSISGFYLITTFSLSYLTQQLGMSNNVALVGNVLFSAAELASMLIAARIADRVGVRRVAIYTALFNLLLSCPFFWLLSTREPLLIWLAIASFALSSGGLYAITGALLAQLFDARVRCSGISLGYQLAAMIGGAPTPFIAAYLMHWTGGPIWAVATFLIASALITLVAVGVAALRPSVAILR